MVRNFVTDKDTKPRLAVASSELPPIVRHTVAFCGRANKTIDDDFKLDFLPPLSDLKSMITRLNKLKEEHEFDYIAVVNNRYLDIVELRNLLVLHDIKNTKYQVEEENEWFRKISNFIRQPNGTSAIDLTLPSIFNSMLHDTNEEHFWPSLQLKTCEIKCLASNRWLSDLILYHIIELINESSPDTFVFYFITDKDTKPRLAVASSELPPIVRHTVAFCGRANKTIDDDFKLDFLPPLSDLKSMITRLNKLKEGTLSLI